MSHAHRLILILAFSFLAEVKSQTCEGNGFVGGCSDIFDLTGKPVGIQDLIGSQSIAEVCEGDILAVVHDCDYRIPLYVTIQLDRTEMDTPNPGRCDSCDFRPSLHLEPSFQATDPDYDGANERKPCYERQTDGRLYRDQFWTGADPDQICLPSVEPETGTSRGHIIADSYITAGDSAKDATYHFTNCIPQYQKFNSESWNIAEQQLYPWAEVNCGSDIADPVVRDNALLHVIVGVVPSTRVGAVFNESHVAPRWFGEWGFGDKVFNATTDYNGNPPATPGAYRVNMPAAMWTAACCIGTDANANVAWVRHMAFGRHAKPIGNDEPVLELEWKDLFRKMLPELDTAGVDLFPSEALCSNPANYVSLSTH
ncbi:hypothetical protein LSH36_301g00068 [Paralvinella palmiformis]|uniref:DNA/RNA non-specific endonuclease/pyrophosphatase/phosphodiesterase domain-containing protein n=1 Tax=Paralvinella palmiformis TaxID=53620 RepID=A0AAD9N2Q5_9ANNE|nr:hypothetical protein LSH36_301g00068 [Paralvinella palmiformis]